MYKVFFLLLGLVCSNHIGGQNQATFAWNKSAPVIQPDAAPSPLNWEPYIDWGQQIFPSFLLSIATADPQQFKLSADYLGDPKSVIGLFVKSTLANTKVSVQVEATRFSAALNESFFLTKAQQQYAIFPRIAWDYDLLRQNKQSIPLNFNFSVFYDGKLIGRKTITATLRSISDCPLAAVDYQGKQVDLRKMFAAYVNEDHPRINELLSSALQKKTVNGFNGYQGKREEVVAQVFAIWRLFRDKGMKYSDIATGAHDEHKQVLSQRVRTFEEAINTAQANCIDGTVVFSSLMRSIGLQPLIVLIPGHAMLGFYVDGRQEDILVLETTLIGETNAGKWVSKHEFAPYINGIAARTQSQLSAALFLKALDTGYEKFMQVWRTNKQNVMIIDIAQARSLYKPIGF